MKDNSRKCAKCNASTAEKPNLVLHRFPKPGASNLQRMVAWAEFCYPDENCSSIEFLKKLHTSHKMLCSKHFPQSAFVENNLQQMKLHRYAIPSEHSTTTQAEVPIGTNSAETSQTASSTFSCIEMTNAQQISQVDIPGIQLAETSNIHPVTDSLDIEMVTHTDLTQDLSLVEIHSTQLVAESTTQPESLKPSLVTAKSSEKEKRLTNKCRRNLRKICSLQKQLRKCKKGRILEALLNDKAVQQLSTDLTSSCAVLLQGQLKNCRRKKKGFRWNLEQKIVALRLYKRSPACYRLLRRMFLLPSQTTLKNLLNKLPLNPGINRHLFDVIKKNAAKLSAEDNEFCLLFDEMSIRKNINYNEKYDQIDGFQDHGPEQGRDQQIASHALVFMLAGIRKKIKQPVAYYLSGDHVTADRLSVLIKEVLQACFEAGISVAATVCDMDGVNRRALSQLGASVDRPFFEFGCNEVITLHDTPHLLKCFRNLFLKYDIESNTNVECNGKPISKLAKWSHIKEFYDLDNSNPFFVFAPALTKSHLNPNNKQKMKVKLAAQVLSHTVAAGMYAKITQGELPTEAMATVNVLNKIDQLFDCLNADSPSLKRGKKFSRNISDRSPHKEYFGEMITFFKNCKFIGARSRAPSLDGWILTMTGVERLWRNLKQKHPKIGSLSTRRLQQDALENCFGCVRSNCGSNCNPTVSQFVAGLKTGIISNLSTPSLATNCENDEAVVLDNLNLFLTQNNSEPTQNTDTTDVDAVACDMPVINEDDIDENTGEVQACAYVCGYILKRKKLNCRKCLETLTSPNEGVCHLFTMFKEYYDNKKCLQYASIDMVKCVEKSAALLNEYLKNNAHERNIFKNFKVCMQKHVSFNFLEKCVEHKEENLNTITKSLFFICINRFCVIKNRFFAENAAHVALQKKVQILKHI